MTTLARQEEYWRRRVAKLRIPITRPDPPADSPAPTLVFRLDWVPPSNNVLIRMSRWRRGRLTATASLLILAAAGGRPDTRERRRVRVTITLHRRRPVDRDNAIGGCKPIFDALVRLGFAHDDREDSMEQNVRPVVVDRRARPWTEIEVERL